MTLKEFSESLGAFYCNDDEVKKIKSLETLLSTVESYFFSEYDKIADVEFKAVKYKAHLVTSDRKSNLRAELKSQIDELASLITKALAYGNIDGKKKFYDFFFKNDGMLKNKKYGLEIPRKKYFFRMRGADSYHVYNRLGLFQMPDTIIRLIGKQRFNQDGIPCLYLGESLYCAWEEVRRKNFDQVNFASFQNTKELMVLDLTIKPTLLRKEDYILAYFALLVSGKVVDSDAHKFQYDVSNLIMDVLQVCVSKNGDVDGIRYMSSRRFDGVELKISDTSRMYGYVFPPKGVLTADRLDKWMRNTFLLTEPRTSFMYDIHLIDFDRTKKAITNDYQKTLFYMIEENLKNEKFDYCDK